MFDKTRPEMKYVRMLGTLSPNTRRVAEVLRIHGPRTRAELTVLTGLSRPTVANGVTELGAAGLVEEELKTAVGPAGGRPAAVVRLARAAGLAIGLDIGRRHVRVAIADLGHQVIDDSAVRLSFDADEEADSVLDQAVELVDRALTGIGSTRDDVAAVGLGLPAPMTKSGRIGSPPLLPAWAAMIAADELAIRLGRPVRVENDANLGALGEFVWGAGQGCSGLVYVKVATGIGGGIVLDGRLYRGTIGTAGELGHVTLDARGPVCRCGNRGCLELSAGGRAMVEHARRSHPQLRDFAELVTMAADGDRGCRRLLADAGHQLGVALGGLVNLLNPDRIVLGGELGAATGLLLEPLRRGLADTAMPAAADAVKVVPAHLGEHAAALGAIALALGVQAAALPAGAGWAEAGPP
ncbi:putative NBD/HSP70 family sugar kinase [Allocatelliglobosispora scoriae]|uniref:Putative NBD/HSP70 family sugar kinase n=1 Tax=Allocatelliglobosispora scoriae TaxID=643052 RepID=A0A841C4K2_9ACTN|nr:ROK family transcriptional regulator [Allocatelliglobosispora scoriae]MBB5873751.1 putative NBD/HSP70 family sugar kinase [Allocatelliglobosispora scoriae]